MDWLKGIFAVCFLLFVIYKYGMRNYNYWKKRGVRQTNPPFPFLGDNFPSIFGFDDAIGVMKRMYDVFKGERFGGAYFLQTPVLVIRDPELLKQIMVKDVEFFANRHNWMNNSDPLLARNLSVLHGEEWRNMRTVMSTVFTSAKMKDMFTFMNKCGQQSIGHIKAMLEEQMKAEGSDKNVLEMNLKDYFCRYGTDVIASTAFGIEIDSFKDRNNEFFQAGSAITDSFRGWSVFRIMFIMCFPEIAKALQLTFLGQKLNKFLVSTVTDNISERERNNIVRKDFINILMEARKGKGYLESEHEVSTQGKIPDLTNLDIAAQAMVFFFGGFESMSSMLSFMSYELAVNPDIQKKLIDEIDEVVESENGVTYEGIMHRMPYLDMAINETMRKWPLATLSDREVVKPYTISGTKDSPELELVKGDVILINIAALHRDPEHFPNPDKFDPERFRDEKNTIKPFTFLSFGAGLRHCVGMRYALMEPKVCIVHLLKEFEIVPTKNTQIPLQLLKNSAFILRPQQNLVFGLKPRY